jgi:hypothetical protein
MKIVVYVTRTVPLYDGDELLDMVPTDRCDEFGLYATEEYTYDREWDGPMIDWAIRTILDQGTTEYSTHPEPLVWSEHDWWSDPDGGHTVDYGTGEEESRSTFLKDCDPVTRAAVFYGVRFATRNNYRYPVLV